MSMPLRPVLSSGLESLSLPIAGARQQLASPDQPLAGRIAGASWFAVAGAAAVGGLVCCHPSPTSHVWAALCEFLGKPRAAEVRSRCTGLRRHCPKLCLIAASAWVGMPLRCCLPASRTAGNTSRALIPG